MVHRMSREGVEKWLKVHKNIAIGSQAAIGAPTNSNYQAVAIMADWCGHCKKLKPRWEKLSGPFFASISQSANGDNPKGTDQYFDSVEGFPTVAILKNGRMITKDIDEIKTMSSDMRKQLR